MAAQNLSSKDTPPPADLPRLLPPWWLPLLLATPAIIPLANSLYTARLKGLVATGFIQVDQASYAAEARQYFNEGFHLLYSNPYAGYGAPRIYFQPHFLLLGCFEQLGLDPGLTWAIYSLLGSLFMAFVGVYFYSSIVGWRRKAEKVGLFCFFWGGGVLTLLGLAYAVASHSLNVETILHFDPGPARGWWMLNFGRNLVYGPTEAYYHGIFLLCMLFLLRRRLAIALIFAAVLSLSHPFTGIEVGFIVATYLLIERLKGDHTVRPIYLAAAFALIGWHVWYYLFYLNRFTEHRVLQTQWEELGISRAWTYSASTFLPALFIVGCLAVARALSRAGFRDVIHNSQDRLFLIWFIVIVAFTQHYRLMRPIQPVHFAHGYDWIALFFLGAPVLVRLLDRLLRIEPRLLSVFVLSLFVVFFVFDNIFWFSTFVSPKASQAILVTKDQKQTLDWLGRNAVPQDMVVTADPMVGFLVATYTRVQSWAGSGPSTPYYDQRMRESEQAFRSGVMMPVWHTMHMLYVKRLPQDDGWQSPPGAKEVFHNDQYEVLDCPANTTVVMTP